ncbi:MAG: hypothetical protein NTX25_01850, partial [Proteobacteria bacterium]|nr:hypothetical protein [Pseudomonadota bacterium]
MWHIIILSILAVHLNSCFNTPIQSSGKVSVLDSSPRASLAKALTEAKAISSFDPESKVETMIQAPSGALSGSSVMMPPGALNFTADLVIEESVPLSQTSVASSLNLRDDLEVQPVGAGLIIRPTTDVDLTRPLTIAMSLDSGTGLRAWLRLGSFLQAKKNYAVFYKSMINGELRDGVIPGSSLRMTDDNKVEFEGYFGAFWLCEVNFPIETKVEAPTQEPAVNVNNVSVMNVSGIVTEEAIVVKAVIPEVTWNSVVISFEPKKRLLSLNAKIGADRSLSSCQVDLRPSVDSNSGINVSSNIDLNFSFRINKLWTLIQSNDKASVFVKFKNLLGDESKCLGDSIIHDDIAPKALSLAINSDASTTQSLNVSLSISAEAATEMYMSNSPDCKAAAKWEAFKPTKAWLLGQSNSLATVSVLFRDAAGNLSSCISDSIQHEIFNFSGLGSTGSEVVGTWPDGTAKIKLSLLSPASSLVGQFLVYFSNAPNLASFDFSASPWQVVGAGDTVYNPSPGSSYIYVGGQGRTFSGKAYFIVRAMSSISGSNPDTNMQVSNLVTIAPAQSNFVYVPPEFSRLSYGYYIGTYEASLNYGSYGNDQITSKESPADDATMNLANCNKTFHENGNP